MHEVLVNRLGGLSLPRKSVVRLTDRPDMTLDVYRGRKTTIQPTNQILYTICTAVMYPIIYITYTVQHSVVNKPSAKQSKPLLCGIVTENNKNKKNL